MDYSGLVYSLTCDDPSLVYIGSSKYDDEGQKRHKQHTKDNENYISGKSKKYCSSFELFAVGNVKITVLEYVYDEPLKQAEQRHISENNCVNNNRSYIPPECKKKYNRLSALKLGLLTEFPWLKPEEVKNIMSNLKVEVWEDSRFL
jgi:hypothetical protein